MAQFDLNAFRKEQMLRDVERLNYKPEGFRGTVRAAVSSIGEVIVAGSTTIVNSAHMLNTVIIKEKWALNDDLMDELEKRLERKAKQPSLSIKGVIMLKSVLIAVSSAVVVVATVYVSLIALIVATSMQKQKGYLMEQTKEEELFLAYETLIATLEECKANPVLANYSTDVEKQVKDFEKDYPEIVAEYYFSHRP